MIKPNAGITDYFSSIKKTDEDKLKKRKREDIEVFIVDKK